MLPILRYDTQDMLWSLLKVKNGALSSGSFSWKAFCGNKLHSIFSSLHSSWLPVFQLPCLNVFSQLGQKILHFRSSPTGRINNILFVGGSAEDTRKVCVSTPVPVQLNLTFSLKHHLGRRGVSKRGHCDLVTVFIQGVTLTQVSSTGALFSNDKDIQRTPSKSKEETFDQTDEEA